MQLCYSMLAEQMKLLVFEIFQGRKFKTYRGMGIHCYEEGSSDCYLAFC